jgi:hypothetical protein
MEISSIINWRYDYSRFRAKLNSQHQEATSRERGGFGMEIDIKWPPGGSPDITIFIFLLVRRGGKMMTSRSQSALLTGLNLYSRSLTRTPSLDMLSQPQVRTAVYYPEPNILKYFPFFRLSPWFIRYLVKLVASPAFNQHSS